MFTLHHNRALRSHDLNVPNVHDYAAASTLTKAKKRANTGRWTLVRYNFLILHSMHFSTFFVHVPTRAIVFPNLNFQRERCDFLRGLRLFGRGKWKKISKMIPTRYVFLQEDICLECTLNVAFILTFLFQTLSSRF